MPQALVATRDLDAVAERLIAKIEGNNRKIDRLTLEVLNNREEIAKMVTREEFQRRFDDIIRGQDKMMAILTRWDAERTAILSRIERLERKARNS